MTYNMLVILLACLFSGFAIGTMGDRLGISPFVYMPIAAAFGYVLGTLL